MIVIHVFVIFKDGVARRSALMFVFSHPRFDEVQVSLAAHIQIAPSPTCSRLSADAAACRPMQPRRPMQLMYLTSRASLVTHCAAMTRGKVTRFVTKPALHSASSSTHPIVFTDTALPMS